MFDLGDTLLYALSNWGETSWVSFRKAFNELLSSASSSGFDHHQYRHVVTPRNSLRVLESLAHCDVGFEGSLGRIRVSPPTLALLPNVGLPSAVLCGSRSPETIMILDEEVRKVRGCKLVVESEVSNDPLSPSRVEVSARSIEQLFEVGNRIGVQMQENPAAWAVLAVSADLGLYRQSLEWSDSSELNWSSSRFDTNVARFRPAHDLAPSSLMSYRNPITAACEYRHWNGTLNAVADLDWGRFLAMEASGLEFVSYDEVNNRLDVCATTPLPILISRGLTLLSGRAPQRTAHPGISKSMKFNFPIVSYHSVPPDVCKFVQKKLGQGTKINQESGINRDI